MAESRYDWRNGPARIQQHSIAKHNILRAYLAAYFQTLVSRPAQEEFRLTLVDAFAGGGRYIHEDTGATVAGSPSIFLEAAREAEYLANKERTNPVRFVMDYFFVDADRHACAHLDKVLREEGYGAQIGKSIHIRHAKFQDEAVDIIEFIKKKSPKNGRSIFSLDQYGYKEVPTGLISGIFAKLPRAEVILTFAVDSFLNFAGDGALSRALLSQMELPGALQGRSFDEIKSSERDWRLFIQSSLHQELVRRSGAGFYTTFFVRNKQGHGDYWLVHMSQHFRARDVMTDVHWKHNTNFIHYGGAGLNMFHLIGYDPIGDSAFTGQSGLGFEFNDEARQASIDALTTQIPARVHAHEEGIGFAALFASTCNSTPASAAIYREAVGGLITLGEVQVVSAEGVVRRSAGAIADTDHLLPPRQRRLLI